MKQDISMPFEKNQYFYGKLLSVEDFELEQKYGEDKRRLMNRLLYGSGIVTGLYVTVVDEQTVSVEKGVALDRMGREIVVDTAVMKKLAMLEGFGECAQGEGQGPFYLCLAYDEMPVMPVHNVTKNVPDGIEEGEADYSRIREKYRLYMTAAEPPGENLSSSALRETVITLYQEKGIRIRQRLQSYAQAGRTAVLFVEVESTDRRNLSFSYELKLRGLSWESLNKVSVAFDEVRFEKTGIYQLSYAFTASEVTEGTGEVFLEADSFRLVLSGEEQRIEAECRMELQIGTQTPKEALLERYYKMTLEETMRRDDRQPVFLARLYLVMAGDSYAIARMERAPYGQYVRNLVLEQALDDMTLQEEKREEEGRSFSEAGRIPMTKQKESNGGILIRGGSCRLVLREGTQKGEIYYSEEIPHGLGLGKTVIQLGLDKGDGLLYYGSPGIFQKKEADLALAARVNPEKGTFLIGIKAAAPIAEKTLTIQWTAIRDQKDTVLEQADRRIYIKPNVLELKARQSWPLEVVCENMPEKTVLWSVSPEGGSVDANGLYTAPNLPGVYEITAASAACPDVKSSLFAVIHEYGEPEH